MGMLKYFQLVGDNPVHWDHALQWGGGDGGVIKRRDINEKVTKAIMSKDAVFFLMHSHLFAS